MYGQSKYVDFRTLSERKQAHNEKPTRAESVLSDGLLIEYCGFEVLYSAQSRIPIWVQYELTADETDGPYTRKGRQFRPDETLSVVHADNDDYRNSGWSRGHMAPAADFKWSDKAMWDTFYYTNCCPQDQSLNNGQWNTLEQKVRSWAKKYGRVFVVTGPIIDENKYGTIGAHRVVVPDAFFKAVLAETPYGLQSVAFVMQNKSHNENMQKCALSVNDLERLTGIDFFSNLPDSIEEDVEGSYDLKFWGLK